MSKRTIYQEAKTLSSELETPLQHQWIGSSKNDWKSEVTRLRKIASRRKSNRKRNYNKALTLSNRLSNPPDFPRNASSLDNDEWKDLNRRMRRQLRAEIKEREIKERRIKQVDTLIENGDYQQVFDFIAIDKKVITEAQAEALLNKIQNMESQSLHIKTSNGQDHFIAINPITQESLKRIFTQGLLEEIANYGSDTIRNYNFKDITSLTLVTLKAERKIAEKSGRFFAYLNTTDLDLKKYQIFTQENAYDTNLLKTREHCLIHSLQQYGIEPALINNIKLSFLTGFDISKKKLKTVADIINRDIVLRLMDSRNEVKKQTYKSDNSNGEMVEIAIYKNHYFVYEDTIYSKYFIQNYKNLKKEKNRENITGKKICGKKIYYNHSKGKKINSLRMIYELFNQEHFKKLDMTKFEESSSNIETRDHVYLENIINEQKEMETPVEEDNVVLLDEKKKKKIYYADCETFTTGEQHELYLLGVVSEVSDMVNIYNACVTDKPTVIKKFLNNVTECGRTNALVYFHNLKYDYNIMEKYLKIQIKCEKEGQLYNVVIRHRGKTVELRDSYKIIPFKLSKFTKEFDLDKKYAKKEAIAYEYYTKNNNDKRIHVDEYKKLLSNNDKLIFDKNMLEKDSSYDPVTKTFNPLTYYQKYLKLDCLVLKYGVNKMDSVIRDVTQNKMSVYDSLTISSLTDKYLIKEGCYKGVYESSGNLRAYLAKAVYGGRVHANPKYVRKHIQRKIADFDGVSLYPSAIYRLCKEIGGLAKGKCVRLTKDQHTYEFIKAQSYSIVTVKITKVNKHQQMPFIAHKSKDSIKYLNTAPTEPVVIDILTLEDYIKFHQIEYEIQDGVFWNQGYNPKIGCVIKDLFDVRLKYKSAKKPEDRKPALEVTLKLMLNSAYGKTIMKKSKEKRHIVKTVSRNYNKKTKKWTSNENNALNYIYNHFNTIKSYRKINEEIWEVVRVCSDNSNNRGHCGVAILAMSKRIMNELFDVANTEKLPIYYTDTDSLHCDYDDVPKLEKAYEKLYPDRKLIGKNLCQFHIDFNLKGAAEDIYATESIFLGKKCYLDVLESKDKNGSKITGFHYRMKGVTEEGILDAASKNGGLLNLYKKLADGNELTFILNPYNEKTNEKKVLMDIREGVVKTKKEFTRTLKFTKS